MAISGKYFIKKWLPDPTLVHGPDFQGGPPGGPGGPGPEGAPAGGPPPAVEKPQVTLKDHGTPPEHFFEGEILFDFEPQPDGTLKGTADGTPSTLATTPVTSSSRWNIPPAPAVGRYGPGWTRTATSRA